MDNVEVILSCSLDVNCPKCGDYFDLFQDEDDGIYSYSIFNNDWDKLKGEGVICPKCDHEFQISSILY